MVDRRIFLFKLKKYHTVKPVGTLFKPWTRFTLYFRAKMRERAGYLWVKVILFLLLTPMNIPSRQPD